jgi:hypothetical protein
LITKNKIYFVAAFAALILAYYLTIRVDAPNYELKLTRHTAIINNTIDYPYKYRLLNPFITEVWRTVLNTALPEKPAFILAYFFQSALVFAFMLFAVFKFFSHWFDEIGALISLLLFSMLVPLTLTGYDVLGDMTTAGIMALGFVFILNGRLKYLFPLMFIGAFNELQIILLTAFYFLGISGNAKDKKVWLNSILLVIVFVAAYMVIYLIRGGSAGGSEVEWYFTKDAEFNIAHKDWIPLWIIMILPLALFAFRDLRSKPEFLKRSAIIVLPLFYFGAFFFIARLREIDKALTIFIILIPLALYTIIPKHIKNRTQS